MDNKDLIKQYVNTGLRLPEYQLNKISPNDLKSYLRVRFMGFDGNDYGSRNSIQPYEYKQMSDEMKDGLVKKIHVSYLDDMMMTLGWRGGNDDFIRRVIRLRSSRDIKDNLYHILDSAHAPISIINELIQKFGAFFTDEYSIKTFLKQFESDEAKINFCHNYLDIVSEELGDTKMTKENSPIDTMVNVLSSDSGTRVIIYFLTLNLKKTDGDTIDDGTFFDILWKTNDKGFKQLFSIMTKYLKLKPNQLKYMLNELNG